ncbi:MAG: DUF6516 family protein [bacterium]
MNKSYLQQIEQKLAKWKLTSEVVLIRRKILTEVDAAYKWQNSDGTLIKRWDNAPHHPRVKTYPHHLYSKSEETILESELMTLSKVLKLIENELSSH